MFQNVALNRHLSRFLPDRFAQMPLTCQNEHLAQGRFPLRPCHSRDPLHDPVHVLARVPQPRQDGYYIIAYFRALQQPFAVQRANIHQPVLEPQVAAAKLMLHAQRSLPHIEQHLVGKRPHRR